MLFPIALSEKCDLCKFARKLYDKATLCVMWQGEEIIALLAGYTDNVENNLGYISIVT